ncbi:ABC transporter ATP-binding protein [Pontixanthobacter sp.]|uniref:ABC transporter ATP-binding protein n=1 Tax=Pontixanthobacter sp. TaxID=2792078 RepID=UPI003C7D2845
MSLSVQHATVKGRIADVSATFQPGHITAICGPNGAGKSTLLSVLTGLLAPGTGRVTLGGAPLLSLPPVERAKRIGYLPQNGEAAWDVSAGNLVALGRMPHRDAAAAPVEAALEALDLGALKNRPMSQLSGGEKARALLARVLAGEPDWILADEPLAALDLAHQLALIGHLRREANAGTGVVIVLHDLAMAMNHADRVLVLNDGELVAEGGPMEALSSANVNTVWGVTTQWIGTQGAMALVSGSGSNHARTPGR